MPRVVVPIQQLTSAKTLIGASAGANEIAGDAANDHYYAGGVDGVILLMRNTDAGARTVTIETSTVVDGDLAVPDRSISLNASEHAAVRVGRDYLQADGTVYVNVDTNLVKLQVLKA